MADANQRYYEAELEAINQQQEVEIPVKDSEIVTQQRVDIVKQ